MINYAPLWMLATIFVFVGCDIADEVTDKVTDKVEKEVERVKSKYQEYIGAGEDRGERPFTVVYQENESEKATLISSQCSSNETTKYVHYETVVEANRRYLKDTENLVSSPGINSLKPFWDMRYVNPVNKYIDGGDYRDQYPNHGEKTGLDTRNGVNNIGIGTYSSEVETSGVIAQSECINGSLAGGATINLWDAPEQFINYGGPQTTFSYRFKKTALTSPWKSNETGNLVMQGYFDKPLYENYGENKGGSVSIGLFMKNKRKNKLLNVVIGIYASGTAWMEEKSGIKFDTSSNIIHVATVISEDSWWSTISPLSKSIQEVSSISNKKTSDDGRWDDFYRVNISYQNLLAILNELREKPPVGGEGQDFGLSPEDWEVTSLMIQYEVEESGGKAILSGSFKGFEAYLSKNPL